MGQDQEPPRTGFGRDLARVIRPLVGFAASRRRFNYHQRSIRAKGGTDTIVAHGVTSEISSA